jgi:hypothetical protein
MPEVRARRRASRFLLTVTYPEGRTRQLSVRRERVDEVRLWLSSYQEPREAIEAICGLNHDLLRQRHQAAAWP